MLPFLDILSPIVGKILDKIPDAGAREKARMEFELSIVQQEQKLLEILVSVDNKQLEVNAEEAKNSSLFVSGARPFILWVCASAFAWSFVLQPIVTYIFLISGHPLLDLPKLNMGELMPVLLGILGLGGLRSYEKLRGVEDRHG